MSSDVVRTSAPPSSSTGSTIERVKTAATVLGAIAAAITGLWGVYEKVRAEARQDTAASYNTLAPQVNQMGEALKQMQQENQQLRQIVAQFQGRPRIAAVPRKPAGKVAGAGATATPGEAKPAATATPGGAPPSGTGAAGSAGAAAGGANGGAPASGPPANGAAPATGTGASSNGAASASSPPNGGAPPASPSEAEEDPDDPVTGLLNTVSRTRAAIESIRKVPDDFGRVLEKKQEQGPNGPLPPPP